MYDVLTSKGNGLNERSKGFGLSNRWLGELKSSKTIPNKIRKGDKDMKKIGTIIEYKGCKFIKKSKASWLIVKGGRVTGYAQNIESAKKAIDNRENREA